MKKNIIGLLLILSVAVVPFFLFYSLKEPEPTIRIGFNNWPGYEFLYLASMKGFYKEEGVGVEIVQYGSLEDVRYGYEIGQIDVIASTIIELLLLKERTNKQPQAFLLADFSNGGDVLLADKTITDLQGLKGKTIGVEPQSLGVFLLYRVLEKGNLNLDDVEIIGMEQAKMVDAMRDGTIQAAISYPPISIEIAKDNNHVIFDSSQIPGEIIDVVSSDKEFITARKNDFDAIKRAWDKAVIFARNNPEEANAIMAKKEGISPAEFSNALSDIKVLLTAEQDQYIQKNGSVEKAINIANQILLNNSQLTKLYNPSSLIYR